MKTKEQMEQAIRSLKILTMFKEVTGHAEESDDLYAGAGSALLWAMDAPGNSGAYFQGLIDFANLLFNKQGTGDFVKFAQELNERVQQDKDLDGPGKDALQKWLEEHSKEEATA